MLEEIENDMICLQALEETEKKLNHQEEKHDQEDKEKRDHEQEKHQQKDNPRQQELTQQRQRANATRKEIHKLSSSDKGKEKVIYAKKKQATLVQPLRDRNVGVQIREVRDMNVTGVREENERAETLARDNQGSSSTGKGKGKENARVTDSNMISKVTLAQRARRERERNLKQGSAYQLGHRSEIDRTIESLQSIPYINRPSLTPRRRRLDCVGQGTNVTQPAEKCQTISHTTSTCPSSIPSTSSTPEMNWHTLSSQVDLCCDDELDMATSLEAPTRAHISLGRHYLGKMDILCPRCSALHWMDERLARSSRSNPLFGTCCLQGKIKLHALITPPPPLKALFDGDDVRSKSFRMYVRVYNTTNAFTSLGATFDDRLLPGRGPTSFTIHGELRHRVGSLLPQQGNDASYAQLYIYDPASALEVRNGRNQQLRRDVLQTIQDTLLQVNPFVEKFRQAHAILDQLDQAGQTLPAHLHYSSLKDRRLYNLPTVDEIAWLEPTLEMWCTFRQR
ncbi:hypothetical protein Vadar_017750 [Vaccinium darrowii]|uniref:Uncharacterized protein n=1 Tax=Vaccinium darrowii TaxID=229202 RepID=A0ACB7XZQ7_9ERIC|nr:hypothetical protein Vadar_017750 [Vaccinium darrowii]